MKIALSVAVLTAVAVVGLPADAQTPSRGAYLAVAGDCVVCHTISDGAPFAGGLKMNTPVGAIYSTNITPDRETGIGGDTFEDFDRAMRRGVARDGHRLYPAMPFPSYARLAEDDMRALYDYFTNEVKPVRQKNTPSEIPAPLNVRWPLALWSLIGGGAPFQPNPDFDNEWNRGAYLVQGLGHCGACHTPRGVFFQEKALDDSRGTYLAGANLDNWSAPNLRGDLNTGLGRWTQNEIVDYLKTGRNRHGVAFGAMRDVVTFSTSNMTDDDLRAIAKYLKSLAPSIDRARPAWVHDARTQDDLRASPKNAGAATYTRQCASCHGLDGQGVGGLPPLAGNPAVLDPDATSLVNIVLNGAPTPDIGDRSGGSMPQYRTFLDDAAIADVVGFIRSGWGNRASRPTTSDVSKLRSATKLGERTIIRQMR